MKLRCVLLNKVVRFNLFQLVIGVIRQIERLRGAQHTINIDHMLDLKSYLRVFLIFNKYKKNVQWMRSVHPRAEHFCQGEKFEIARAARELFVHPLRRG